jgi:hypothetical protein
MFFPSWYGKDGAAQRSGRGHAVPSAARTGKRHSREGRPRLEWLENRILFAGDTLLSATMLPFSTLPLPATVQTAHVSGFLKTANQVDLYRIHLDNAGDKVTAAVSAQDAGSGLQSILRVFDSSGKQLALDDQEGGDPHLTFQASAAGDYFVGVSSDGDDAYAPTVTQSGHGGTSTGLYTLDLSETAAPLAADLTGGSFRLSSGATAAYGEKVSGTFTVENRGGADSGAFAVQLVLSTGTRFDRFDASQALQNLVLTSSLPGSLNAGEAYSAQFTAALPASAPPGFAASGPVYVGLRITPGNPATDGGQHDKSGVHRGEDFESLTIVTPAPAGTTDLSGVDGNLSTRVDGTLSGRGTVDVYTFTVTRDMGSGELRASVTSTGGTLVPRLTLSTATGQVLCTSDGGTLVQNLAPGTYLLTVSVQGGAGDYRLSTEFVRTSDPFEPAVGTKSEAVAVADLTGDGIPDLVVANEVGGTVSVLLGNGDGSFQKQQTFPVGTGRSAVAVADVNGDGKPDLLVANQFDDTVSVLLGQGNGTFTSATSASVVGLRNTPYLANLTGHADGTLDSVILDRSGDILFRQGLPGSDGGLAPPVTINAKEFNPQTGKQEEVTVHDLTVLLTPAGWAVATADAMPDPTILASQHRFLYTVSLYVVGPDGKFQRTTACTTPLLPTRIAAADLGNGLDDIVVADGLDNSVQVALQRPDGSFSPLMTLPVGLAPSDIAVVPSEVPDSPFPTVAALRQDIVVTDQASGDVAVLLNQGNGSFAPAEHFRAGTGLYGLDTSSGSPAVASLVQSVSLATGNVTGDGRDDLVVVNRGAHSFSVLANDGNGGFLNPQADLTTSTSDGFNINNQPGPAVAGYFQGADKPLDLAVLMEDNAQVWIFTGDGQGHFTHTFSISAGAQPTGLNVVRDASTGNIDLLVGNVFGDVLRLQGNGDGTFQPPADNRVGLSVTTFGGQIQVLIGNAGGSDVKTETFLPGSDSFGPLKPVAAPVTTRTTPFAPGDAQWYMLDTNSATPEAVVMDAGGNRMQTYRYDPTTGAYAMTNDLAVGDDPVSVTIATLPGTSAPDLFVANKGSNDVSVILGSYQNGQWVGTPGPRLKSTGSGPMATSLVPDASSPGGYDLAITNQDGTVSVLPGRGQGFFNDTAATTAVNMGTALTNVSLLPSGTAGFAVAQDGQVIGFNIPAASEQVAFTPPSGEDVLAVDAVTATDFVVAETGGVVEDPVLDETFASLDGTPDTPSALQVLETPAGEQVLVTNAGSDTVFVFTVFSPEPTATAALSEQPTSLPGEGSPDFVFTTTSVEEAPLTVVVTITADTLPEGGSGSSTAQFLQSTQPTDSGGDEAGGDDANLVAAAPATDPTAAPGFVPAGDDTPGSDLYRPTEEPDFLQLLARARFLPVLREAERLLATLWGGVAAGAGAPGPAGPALAGDAPPASAVTSEMAVATLQARQTAALVCRQEIPAPAAAHEQAAVPASGGGGAGTGRAASAALGEPLAVVVVDEQRARWLALLAALSGLGLLRPVGDTAGGVEGNRPPDRRALPLGPSRPNRPARRGRGSGGDS